MSAEKVPFALTTVRIKQLLPFLRETLDYVALCGIENATEGGLHYDQKTDSVIYYAKINNDDRELYPYLQDVSEAWVITRSGTES